MSDDFILIKDGQLNVKHFKKIFKTLKWVKAPRKLTEECKEFFYLGQYEDDKYIIKIKVRPSMRMQVEESFKNRLLDGRKPSPKNKQKTCTWGTSIEVVIDKEVLKKIDDAASLLDENKVQKISWS